MRRQLLAGLLAVVLVSTGCASTQGGSSAASSGTLDRIKATKTLNLGYRDSSVPFSFAGPEQKPTGYSVDLCNRVADDLKRDLQIPDLAVKWTMVTVDTRMTAVQNGTIDLECGSTTNTLSRQALVDFSLTTFVTGASLLALKDTLTADPTKLRIAVIPGMTTEKVIKEVLAKAQPPVQFISVKDHADGRTAIENKTADAYASDREILIGLALTAQNPASFALADRYFSYEPYALVLRRGDPDFRIAVNRSLARLFRTGDIIVIYQRWLGALGAPGAIQLATWAIEGLPE